MAIKASNSYYEVLNRIKDNANNTSKLVEQAKVKQEEYNNDVWRTIQRSTATLNDFQAEVNKGLLGSIESIVDTAASVVGAIGGIFSDDFKKGTENFIKQDYTEKLYGWYINNVGIPVLQALRLTEADNYEELQQESYISTLGETGKSIVRGVGQGVGQIASFMIPMGAASVVGKGAGAAAQVSNSQKLIKAAQLTIAYSQGHGAAVEEALVEGQDLNHALAYGVGGGITELLTEQVSEGVGKLLKLPITSIPGAYNLVNKATAGSTGKIIATLAGQGLSEGAEEMLSDIAMPWVKKLTYSTHPDVKYDWNEVLIDGTVGAITGALGGSINVAQGRKLSKESQSRYAYYLDRATEINNFLFENDNLNNEAKIGLLNELKLINQELDVLYDQMSDKDRKQLVEALELESLQTAENDVELNQENNNNLEAIKEEVNYGENQSENSNGTNDIRGMEESYRNEIANVEQSRGDRVVHERLQGRLRDILQGRLGTERRSYSDGNGNVINFEVYNNVDGETFRSVFESNKQNLVNGELVDLHNLDTTYNKDGSVDSYGYKDMKNFLSDDGMQGVAVEPDGNIVSLFNNDTRAKNNPFGKKGWTKLAIDIATQNGGNHLDAYDSSIQPLGKIYAKYGFKVTSRMEYNMDYDHDNIGQKHNKPEIVFMVYDPNNELNIEEKYFDKSSYDEAKAYQMQYVKELTKQTQNVTVAPYRFSFVEDATVTETLKEADTKFRNNVKNIAEALDIEYNFIGINQGGYLSNEGEYKGKHVNEISYSIEVNETNTEKVDLFAALSSDLGYEVQEAVIASNYVKVNDGSANGLEIEIQLQNNTGFDNIRQKLIEIGLMNYTYNMDTNSIKFTAIYEFENIDEFKANIRKFNIYLKENNYYAKQQSKEVNSRYLDRRTRQSIYGNWMRTFESSGRRGRLYNVVQEASKRLNEDIKREEGKQVKTSETNTSKEEVTKVKDNTANKLKEENTTKPKNSKVDFEPDNLVEEDLETYLLNRENDNPNVNKSTFEKKILGYNHTPGEVAKQAINYVTLSNKETIAYAQKRFDKYGDNSDLVRENANKFIDRWQRDASFSVDELVEMSMIVNKLSSEDPILSRDLLDVMTMTGTQAGQYIQMFRAIYSELTPQGKLRVLNKLEAKNNRKYQEENRRKINKKTLKRRYSKYFNQDAKLIANNLIDSIYNRNQTVKQQVENVIKHTDLVNLQYNENGFAKGLFDKIKVETKNATEARRLVNNLGKELRKLQTKYNEQFVLIPETLKREYLEANTSEEASLAMNKIIRELDGQYQATFFEKMNALRSLAMLSNFKTHGRNIIGNEVMRGVNWYKNKIKAGLEKLILRNKDSSTISYKKTPKEFVKYANKIFTEMYQDGPTQNKYDMSSKRIFQNETLEKIRRWNMTMLEKEDQWAMKKVFSKRLGQIMTARNYDISMVENSPSIKAELAELAYKEAQEVTFKETSKLADNINKIQNTNNITQVLIGATIPFKKTPINIAKQGFRYSPLGIIKTIADYKVLKKTDINTFVEGMSKGLAGTSIMTLGMALAAMGLVSVGDDDEYAYNNTTGKQNYSLNIGDVSVTLDWLSPSAIPLFTGAALYEAINSEGKVDEDVMTKIQSILATTIDPIQDMSVLQSINNLLTSGSTTISDLVVNTVENYGLSFIPTISNQLAKIVDPYVRSTTATNNCVLPKDIQRYLNKILTRIPGLSMMVEPYVDAWGNTSKNYNGLASFVFNAVEQTASPGWWSITKQTDADIEIGRLYGVTGDSTIIPSLPNSYYTRNGERVDMTSQEYTQYKINVGQANSKILNTIVKETWYKQLAEEDKIKLINEVYSLTREYYKYSNASKLEEYVSFFNNDYTKIVIPYLRLKRLKATDYQTRREVIEKEMKTMRLTLPQRTSLLELLGFKVDNKVSLSTYLIA